MNILDGKVMGVIGGMGPLATNVFYEMIIEKTPAECDQDHINMIILSHATMPDRTEAIKAGRTEEIFEKLVKDAGFLEESGACCIAVPCNTSHFILDRVQEKIGIPIVNMIKEAAAMVQKAVASDGCGESVKPKVGIMATDGTVEMGLYQKALADAGLEPVVPSPENQKKVMKIIYEGIKKGMPVDHGDFKSVADEFKSAGCEKVLMACTELSVYKIQAGLDDHYMDAMEALALKAIEICGKQPGAHAR